MALLPADLRRLADDRPVVTLIGAVLACELVGASGSVFTARGLASWYDTLVRPAIAPPNWVFGPVWTALFALLGVAVWLVWRRADEAALARRVRIAVGVFVLQYAVNVAWSAAFFGLRSILGGLVVVVVLWLLVAVTVRAFAVVDRRAALLLVPYLAWVSFAAYLNYRFWVLN
ncbi:MAG: TspO/MBR family protein [Haloferacaceae archaeon]